MIYKHIYKYQYAYVQTSFCRNKDPNLMTTIPMTPDPTDPNPTVDDLGSVPPFMQTCLHTRTHTYIQTFKSNSH